MLHERFGSSHATRPSAEELRMAKEAHEAADPTQFSELPIQTPLTPVGGVTDSGNPLMTDGRHTFVQLSERPKTQQITARLLKGIMNVADVVEGHDAAYYSKKMPHARIDTNPTVSGIRADVLLLKLIMHDSDHAFAADMLTSETRRSRGSNMQVEHGNVSYFDFEMADLDSVRHYALLPDVAPAVRAELQVKLSKLKEQYESDEGEALFKRIVSEDPEINPEHAYRIFMNRISHAEEEIRGT